MRYFAVLIISVLFNTCTQNQSTTYVSRKALKQEQKPHEAYFQSRLYPQFYLNPNTLKQALHEAKKADQQQRLYKTTTSASWELEGPLNIGGRINSIAVHPTNTNVIYIGTSSAGMYRTSDGGQNWETVGDEFVEMAIADIVFDPSNSNTMYVATGDVNISGNVKIGYGVYKSIDGGNTWNNIGLENTGVVSKIVIDPLHSDTIYVATMGKHYVADQDRGVYKSTDGGANWTPILQTSTQAGAIDLVMDPVNNNTLYCAMFDRLRNNTLSLASGPNSMIWKTTDGGINWNPAMNGLPMGYNSRISLDVSSSTPNFVVCSVVDSSYNLAGVYKSTDAASTWQNISGDIDQGDLSGFGWYFGNIKISPFDDDVISVLGLELQTTTNGGLNWNPSTPPWYTYEVHSDKHDLVYIDANTVLLATDGGLYITTNNMVNWDKTDFIPNTEFYRIAINPHQSGVYAGGAQDNGTSSGNHLDMNWPRENGGDGFQPMYDPNNPYLRFYETQNGGITYDDLQQGIYGYSWDDNIDYNDRRNWNMPIIMSEFNSTIFYTGTHKIYKNVGGPGNFWNAISSDLTDGNIYGEKFHTISSLCEWRSSAGKLYVGTSDGNVWKYDGSTWTDITDTLPDRYVSSVQTTSNGSVFVSHSGYLDGDYLPRLHKSIDEGQSWIDISSNLPNVAINDIVVHPDFGDQTLFVATDAGVYGTEDGGATWTRTGDNMPYIPVLDLEIDGLNNRLVAGTYGRSMQSIALADVLTKAPTTRASSSDILVFPNPSSGQINITSTIPIQEVFVYSLKGDLVQKSTQNTLNLKTLQNGVYLINVKTFTGITTKKIVLKK